MDKEQSAMVECIQEALEFFNIFVSTNEIYFIVADGVFLWIEMSTPELVLLAAASSGIHLYFLLQGNCSL